MEELWYQSSFGKYVCKYLCIAAFIGESMGSPALLGKLIYEKIMGNQNEYKIQQADLNHNGIPEKFYTIDDKVALVEGDGKPAIDLLKK